jgi:hypothetical protein
MDSRPLAGGNIAEVSEKCSVGSGEEATSVAGAVHGDEHRVDGVRDAKSAKVVCLFASAELCWPDFLFAMMKQSNHALQIALGSKWLPNFIYVCTYIVTLILNSISACISNRYIYLDELILSTIHTDMQSDTCSCHGSTKDS